MPCEMTIARCQRHEMGWLLSEARAEVALNRQARNLAHKFDPAGAAEQLHGGSRAISANSLAIL